MQSWCKALGYPTCASSTVDAGTYSSLGSQRRARRSFCKGGHLSEHPFHTYFAVYEDGCCNVCRPVRAVSSKVRVEQCQQRRSRLQVLCEAGRASDAPTTILAQNTLGQSNGGLLAQPLATAMYSHSSVDLQSLVQE